MESLVPFLADLWQVIAAALTFALSAIASAHAVLYKRDSRAAVSWVGVIWLVPVIGAVLYVLLGINRIRRQAADLRQEVPILMSGEFPRPELAVPPIALPKAFGHLRALAALVDRVAGRRLLAGNAVRPLEDGDEAYPAMLAAIDAAQDTIGFATYIFDHDRAGARFLEALERAARRGVDVRVLVDTVGARYSRPPITHALERRGIRVALFGRTVVPWRMPFMNLRNHRKILVVDGRVGFTGGINIREGCVIQWQPRRPVRDLHFRLDGPVVAQLSHTFAEDWAFVTHERLLGYRWFPPLEPVGESFARGINDGPDEDFEKARFVFLGALACARDRVRIVTPYFVPDQGLISALDVAALRGVRVEIVLPAKNNLPFVQWAATAQLWQVLHRGCRVFLTPPPFDHSKLMLVDDGWALLGSTNWDARSLRLNFEFGVECYDADLAERLHQLVDRKVEAAREVTAADVNGRPLPVKLRDGVARLAAPYL